MRSEERGVWRLTRQWKLRAARLESFCLHRRGPAWVWDDPSMRRVRAKRTRDSSPGSNDAERGRAAGGIKWGALPQIPLRSRCSPAARGTAEA